MSNVINLPNASEDKPDTDLAERCHTNEGKLNKFGRKVVKNQIQRAINDAQRRLDNDELFGVIFLYFDKLDKCDDILAGSVPSFILRKYLLEMIAFMDEKERKDYAAH